jgi:putative transposase
MVRPFDFSIGEWYHVYSRGIDKRITFEDKRDYDRFLSLLYLANSDMSVTLFNKRNSNALRDALDTQRGSPLVELGAYSLMPNHYHLVIKEIVEDGTSEFMRKLGIGYTMYFNTRYQRTGNLFAKPFRARHIKDDAYLQKVVGYVHLNPAELIEPGWKNGRIRDLHRLRQELTAYPNCSLKDFLKQSLPTRHIIGSDIFDVYQSVPMAKMLQNAHEYYKTMEESY